MSAPTHYEVWIDGNNITSSLAPLLISMNITLKDGGSSDKVEITLDDKNAQISLPRDEASMVVKLKRKGAAFREVFRGKVTDVTCEGSRGEPDILSINADGVDSKGKAKEPKEKHWDDKTIKTILQEAGQAAGFASVTVDPDLGAIIRKYEAMRGESFMAFGQRLAEEIGGTFKIADGRVALVKRSSGKSVSGRELPVIRVARGENLIKWSIAPFQGRSRFKTTKTRYYDAKEAKWKEVEVKVDDEGAKATNTARFTAPNKEQAESRAKSDKTSAEREKGSGSVTIDGDETAQPEAPVDVSAIRPGVDGKYTASEIKHSVSRSGFTTDVQVKKPAGDAGKDKRKPKGSAAS